MRRVTATEAARKFSEMLDSVEGEHETFVVMRRGRAVATIGPATGATGRDVKALLADRRPDRGWEDELRALRDGLGSETDPWHG